MLKIFVDTNVLIHAHDWKIRITEAIDRLNLPKYQVLVHPLVFQEILEASNDKGTLRLQAKLALQTIDLFEYYEDKIEYKGTDTALLESALRENGAVLTFDKELMKRCKEKNVPVLYVKSHAKLILIGYINE
jgi:rRNA-processing protein FCF1